MCDLSNHLSWVAQRNGEVLLRDVGIVAACPRKDDRKVKAELTWPEQGYQEIESRPKETKGLVELNEFLASFWPHIQDMRSV